MSRLSEKDKMDHPEISDYVWESRLSLKDELDHTDSMMSQGTGFDIPRIKQPVKIGKITSKDLCEHLGQQVCLVSPNKTDDYEHPLHLRRGDLGVTDSQPKRFYLDQYGCDKGGRLDWTEQHYHIKKGDILMIDLSPHRIDFGYFQFSE